VTPGEQQIPAARVLLVCTANQCRSPLAGAILSAVAKARGIDLEIGTAGLGGDGAPATDVTVAVAEGRGLDLGEHRSRTLTPDVLEDADLILGMERVHAREAVVLRPSVWPRSFTLKEFVRRAERIGARPPDEDLSVWIARIHAGRERVDLLGASPLDDVSDPTGGTLVEHEDTADVLDDLVERLVRLAWPRSSVTPFG
jgi:protein-tyrosine phosphatase